VLVLIEDSVRVESTLPQERSANDGERFRVSCFPMDVEVLTIHREKMLPSLLLFHLVVFINHSYIV